jgi:hypothetical protein
MKYKNNYPLFSWRFRAVVVNLLSIIGLGKARTVSVPDFAVQMYRKVPQSTAKRVKKFGPESVADCHKVMATMMIREVDEVPKKRVSRKCTAKSAYRISALTHGIT